VTREIISSETWHYGDTVAIRAMINGKLWLAQSTVVVKDTHQETVLLLAPGAQCAYPSGYWQWKLKANPSGSRWADVKSMAWTLRRFEWRSKRMLIVMEPDKVYATCLIWDGASDRFLGYYINFQTPFQRSACGFNTLDLELDIVIEPDFRWSYKDEEAYQAGLREGCIAPEWHLAIESAKPEILARINERLYPLDGTWLDWRPDSTWAPSRLPEGWERT
jgi:predicted RNA-binding protein associated with RNAse of E/G family